MNKAGIWETWQRSKWLKDSLCLILDEDCKASLAGYAVSYNKEIGLVYQ